MAIRDSPQTQSHGLPRLLRHGIRHQWCATRARSRATSEDRRRILTMVVRLRCVNVDKTAAADAVKMYRACSAWAGGRAFIDPRGRHPDICAAQRSEIYGMVIATFTLGVDLSD
ncbi:hypothetical protein EVAR_5380_1 [Eumeta japonica]|uniref:Uncharacterized protein n=1 Tax=Eumeta variegata TaxID=151549 RepID=A0A4C1TME8_EUMVA|nr:hypothetical protein EVAR_5380_1 [Eumeta japonica]